MVADRGLLSLDNIAELTTLTTATSRQVQFILAVPARCYRALGGTNQPARSPLLCHFCLS